MSKFSYIGCSEESSVGEGIIIHELTTLTLSLKKYIVIKQLFYSVNILFGKEFLK